MKQKEGLFLHWRQHQIKSISTHEDKPHFVQWPHQAHPLWGAAPVKFQGPELHPSGNSDNTPPASFPPHITCNNFHMGHGPQALTGELGEGERVTNLLFFFLYFHYHQIWDECYFCKTQHKKNHSDKTAESEALHPSTHPSRRLSQPWGCSEQPSFQNETLRDKLGDICSAELWQEPSHRYCHSSVLPETHWSRPTW